MNVQRIIESGELEAYVLGMLDEEAAAAIRDLAAASTAVRSELEIIEKSLQEYVAIPEQQIPTAESLLEIIDSNEAADAMLKEGEFPFLDRYADAALWLQAVKHLTSENYQDTFTMIPLREDNESTLHYVQTTTNIEAEEHSNEKESFLILQGSCTCYVGNTTYHLKAGDFLEVPMYTQHDVVITSEVPVIAVLQRLKTA